MPQKSMNDIRDFAPIFITILTCLPVLGAAVDGKHGLGASHRQLLLLAERRGRDPFLFLKDQPEVVRRGKAAGQRDRLDALGGVDQLLLCLGQPHREQKVHRRAVGVFLEIV